MRRLTGLVSTAVVTLIAGGAAGASAQPAQVRRPAPTVAADYQALPQGARPGSGSLHGVVSDESGGPIAGVTVSAIGETMLFAVTDRKGRFQFDKLPAGQYLLRANRTGFSLPQREYVTVRGSTRAVKWLSLRRTQPVPTSGDAEPRVLAAGLGGEPVPLVENTAGETTEPGAADPDSPHPHTEVAWRLRHMRRNVLKDSSEVVPGSEEVVPLEAADFAGAPAAFGSIFGALPFSGEINLLTSGTGPGQLFGDGMPRGITYVQLGNTTENAAGWAVQAARSDGDVSSWILAGSFSARGPRAHAFDMGLSFGAQEYAGGSPALLAVQPEGSRRVGGVYGFDNWAISPRVHLTYGTRVARYDYVDRQELWSPRAALAMNIANRTHLRLAVSQRMRAPGAEEFLPPPAGAWIPPERTFSSLDGGSFRVERIREIEVAVDREFQSSSVITFRRFVERVDDQLVTIFGGEAFGAERSDVGHYLVGTAGTVDADGWGVKVASSSTKRLRGAVDYTLTRARWAQDVEAAEYVEQLAPSAVRTRLEHIHDVAMSGEADILETATHVFFYYRMSTGYTRGDEGTEPALGGRFDLQVKQGLPFIPLRNSEWQVLVGIRDLFRDPLESSSTYDELLVVRPPKRVIGGVQVKF